MVVDRAVTADAIVVPGSDAVTLVRVGIHGSAVHPPRGRVTPVHTAVGEPDERHAFHALAVAGRLNRLRRCRRTQPTLLGSCPVRERPRRFRPDTPTSFRAE